MDEEIEEALEYAIKNIGIEDMHLTEEEKENIIEHLKRNASDGSFLYSIAKEFMEKQEEDKNVKNRK